MRQRRQQAAAKGDWFQTQGKYILVVFLLSLIVTIFLARGKDDSPQSPVRQPIEQIRTQIQDSMVFPVEVRVRDLPLDLMRDVLLGGSAKVP